MPEETVEEQELPSLAKGATSIGKILMFVLLAAVSSAAGSLMVDDKSKVREVAVEV